MLDTKEQLLLEVLNKLCSIQPIPYALLGQPLQHDVSKRLEDLESSHTELVIVQKGAKYNISPLSLMSTISNILCDKRLMVYLDGSDNITEFVLIDDTGNVLG